MIAPDESTPRPKTVKPPRNSHPRTQAERRETTMQAILDVAEMQFAHHGRDGVTIKAVAAAAGVNTALIHYYFEDLEGLFEAVWARRASVINPVRLAALDAYRKDYAGSMTAEGAIDAFLRPVFEFTFRHGEGWSHFTSLVAMTNTTRYGGASYMDEHFDAVVHRLIEMLRIIAADVDERNIYWLVHHLLGSLTITMAQTGRINQLSGGMCRTVDMEDALRTSVTIFAHGLEALRRRGT